MHVSGEHYIAEAEMKVWFSLVEASRNSPLPESSPFYNGDLTFTYTFIFIVTT